jgi:hypothetical protein
MQILRKWIAAQFLQASPLSAFSVVPLCKLPKIHKFLDIQLEILFIFNTDLDFYYVIT